MDDMEYAGRAREATRILDHRLYVLSVEKKWDERDDRGISRAEGYIPHVMDAFEALLTIMEAWEKSRKSGGGAPGDGE